MSLETPRPPPSSQLVSLLILPACQPAVYLPVIVCPCTGLPVRPYYLYVCEDLNLHMCLYRSVLHMRIRALEDFLYKALSATFMYAQR